MADFESLTMTEIIRLQEELSRTLKRRFEKSLAVAFSDMVDSTPYFARFGDEAGRGMQQRHLDLLTHSLALGGGRIVDTAGDGAFTCYPTVDGALATLIELQKKISASNVERPREHQLGVRIGIHFGPVLTDGHQVTGDSVNVCSRVASTAAGGEIHLTREAFHEISTVGLRLSCEAVSTAQPLKGITRPVEILRLHWRDQSMFPSEVVIEETKQIIKLPERDIIAFGRLAHQDGAIPANDIVLTHPDPSVQNHISRWHFELRRHTDGFVLRAVSDQTTEVDGAAVPKGTEVPIRPGTTVRLAKVLTLRFESPSPFDVGDRTEFGNI